MVMIPLLRAKLANGHLLVQAILPTNNGPSCSFSWIWSPNDAFQPIFFLRFSMMISALSIFSNKCVKILPGDLVWVSVIRL